MSASVAVRWKQLTDEFLQRYTETFPSVRSRKTGNILDDKNKQIKMDIEAKKEKFMEEFNPLICMAIPELTQVIRPEDRHVALTCTRKRILHIRQASEVRKRKRAKKEKQTNGKTENEHDEEEEEDEGEEEEEAEEEKERDEDRKKTKGRNTASSSSKKTAATSKASSSNSVGKPGPKKTTPVATTPAK